MGSRLIRLPMKGVLQGMSFALSKTWLVLGGAVSPQPVKPQMPERQEHRK